MYHVCHTVEQVIIDTRGDTFDNADRGCVYQRKPILRHFEQASEK